MSKKARQALLVVAAVLVIAGIALFFSGSDKSKAADGEIILQPVDRPGPNTFTPSVADPSATSAISPTAPTPSSSGLTQSSGSAPGLYAGTRDLASCRADQLVAALEANAGRAKAWASAAGIGLADIRAYVATLTGVQLRVDTRVTDFGFARGRGIARQLVLQSGTPVMIDRLGVPRVRCTSGNPLDKPRPVAKSPRYTGPSWVGFSPTTIVVVVPAPPINVIILIDPRTAVLFGRIPGSVILIDIDRPAEGVLVQVVQPGQLTTVSGSRWPPGTPLQVTFDNPAVTLANPTADGAGNFSVQVTIPPGALPGVHQVTITGAGFTVQQAVYVIPPTVRVLAP